MKHLLLVTVAVALGAFACSGTQATFETAEQGLYDCADPAQRFTCDPPADPDKRFVCHATGSKGNPYNKLAVPFESAHVPGVAHGNKPPDQAPGASGNDLGGGSGLDCDCEVRMCADACTGAADGTACDDNDKCTTDGTCSGGTCQPGAPRCIGGTQVDACNTQSGACDAETGACAIDAEPAGTSCGASEQCDDAGVCVAVNVVINEAESNGGVPGDWVELYNAGTTLAYVGGWRFLDADDTHVAYVIPAGTTLAPGAYLVLDEAQFGFGLGGADNVRLFDNVGLVDSYAWTAHAVTTYGRCPNGTGGFTTTSSSTKGAANDCALRIRINEIESNGGVPGDWVELINAGPFAIDISGWTFKDSDDTHAYVLPAGSTIAAGAYLLLDEAQFGFGLGAADSARLFDASSAVIDAHAWTAHAPITYGRCPNGTGAFTTTTSSKGAANDCSVKIRINEIESNGGVPGDWVELINTGSFAVDVSGWTFKDSDDTHAYALPAGSIVAAGAYLVLDESQFGFGLGAADSARLFDTSGTIADSHAWTAHAPITYGRCPNGTGTFTTTTSTKGAANDCTVQLRINEIESNGGVPGDWVELINAGSFPVDISGWTFKDNDDTHAYVLPAGTIVAAGAYLVLDEAQFGFGLGAADSARLFDTSGALVDSHAWTAHAPITYGRCPNGTGAFTTTPSTKGIVNDCGGTTPTGAPWPGANAVTALDVLNAGNVSGLVHDGSVLWAVQNGPSTLFRIDGATVTSQTLLYPSGGGEPDAEDVTIGGDGAFYVATERDNAVSLVSRPSILRYVAGPGATLVATNEWNLAADLPVLGANVGLEAITFVPDTYLVSIGFYNPALFPNHGTGLYFVGVEQTGAIYAYALDVTANSFARVATFPSGDTTSKALSFDVTTGYLWQHCGAACAGQTRVLTLGASGTVTTKKLFDRPTTMGNLANEGIAIAPCVGTSRRFFWADDGNTDSRALRADTIPCGAFITP